MKKLILTILIFINLIYCFSQTTNNLVEIKKSELRKINSELRVKKVNNEKVEIEVNKFGKITEAKGNQTDISLVFIGKYIVPGIENNKLVEKKYQIKIRNKKLKDCKIIHADRDTIKSQVLVAVQLSEYMRLQKYSEAIKLFSKEQRKNIKGLEKDTALFAYWCDAWIFDDQKLNLYLQNILNRKKIADFKLEKSTWKINKSQP